MQEPPTITLDTTAGMYKQYFLSSKFFLLEYT